MLFGENITKERRKRGWTRVRLYIESGVSINTIADIENGRNKQPSYEKVVRICKALEADPEKMYPI